MNTNLEEKLKTFVNNEDEINNANATCDVVNIEVAKREGLIERVDKIFVTSDGRQLLREQY